MTPARTTPETLARIRAAARVRGAPEIASDLGWEVPRLMRTAARFRIELYDRPPAVVAEIVAPPIPRPVRPEPRKRNMSRRLLGFHGMTLDQISAELPLRQRQVFEILRHEIDGRYVGATEIAVRIQVGYQPGNIINSLMTIGAKLRGARWNLQSNKGHGGGYRLITLRSE